MPEFAELFDMIGSLWVLFTGMVAILWAFEQIAYLIWGE